MLRPSPQHEALRDGEPPRKRIRKGTKSCWECKRRKVRCQLSTEDVAVCSGCRARGTTCLSQEYPEEQDPSGGTNVGERLGRVELLLEKIVLKMSQYEEEEQSTQIHTPESMTGNDLFTPFTAGVTGLFDSNEIIGNRDDDARQFQANTPSGLSTTNKRQCRPQSKRDRLRPILVGLLPTQSDANTICVESECWLLLHALSEYSADVFDPQKETSSVSTTFDMSAVSKEEPTSVAKTLLYLAICIQQLPSDFNLSRLHLTSRIDLYETKIISTVQSLVTSDDEIVASLEGLECLVLLGVYHTNSGNPRRAWLSFRRAINFAQLMGLHKSNDDIMTGSKRLWHHIERADRYLALLLGMPPGSESVTFRPEENFQNPVIDKNVLFSRKLVEISDLISKRNESKDFTTYATTQSIDEKLDNLANAMPETWWAIPGVIAPSRTAEAAMQVDYLFVQIWYFQLQGLLHLPFMLLSSKDRKYNYSRYICLRSARALIYRYLALRYRERTFCCKIIDFAPLTATVTIFLGLLDPPSGEETREARKERECDRTLVQTLLQCMEAESGRHDIAINNSVNVIKALLEVESSDCATNNLRILVPYFGTINIKRTLNNSKISTAVIEHQETLPDQSQVQQDLSLAQSRGNNIPIVQFTSSQFPPLPPDQALQDWDLPEADTVLFDSLLNTDIESNWVF